MYSWVYEIQTLITSSQTGDWCRLPYPNHPKGCPKYGKDKWCPPQAPNIYDFFDMSKPLYIVHSEFDLAAHCKKMQTKLPKWSDLQCRCVLYWQGTSRSQLKGRVNLVHFGLGTNLHTTCPEAMGVNVYATARLAGLKLERIRGLKTCRHVAILGWKKLKKLKKRR